jgi:hypothetical protein
MIEPDQPQYRLVTDYVYDAFGNKIKATVTGNTITARKRSRGLSLSHP